MWRKNKMEKNGRKKEKQRIKNKQCYNLKNKGVNRKKERKNERKKKITQKERKKERKKEKE